MMLNGIFELSMIFQDLGNMFFFAQCKALRNKTFNIAKNRKYDGYQRAFVSLFCKFFNKKTSAGTVKNEVICNEELAEELCKNKH